MSRARNVTRKDGSIVRLFAPGDGMLSYVVEYQGRAQPYNVTDDEAAAICPPGWTVFMDGPYHRARKEA